MSDLFSNAKQMLRWELGLGCLVLALNQIQGLLPSLDFLSKKQLSIASFGIATVLILVKAAEMFFSKTAAQAGTSAPVPPAPVPTNTLNQ